MLGLDLSLVELTAETAEMLRDYIEEQAVNEDEEIFPPSDKTYQEDVKDSFTAAGIWINDGPDADQYKVSPGKSFVSCHWLRHNRNTPIKKNTARWLASNTWATKTRI